MCRHRGLKDLVSHMHMYVYRYYIVPVVQDLTESYIKNIIMSNFTGRTESLLGEINLSALTLDNGPYSSMTSYRARVVKSAR